MTRKDYTLLADGFKQALNSGEDVSGILASAQNVADRLGRDNGRFDYVRFMDACGFSNL